MIFLALLTSSSTKLTLVPYIKWYVREPMTKLERPSLRTFLKCICSKVHINGWNTPINLQNWLDNDIIFLQPNNPPLKFVTFHLLIASLIYTLIILNISTFLVLPSLSPLSSLSPALLSSIFLPSLAWLASLKVRKCSVFLTWLMW